MDLKNRNVLIIGSGISGIAAAKLLADEGCNITLSDSNVKLDKAKIEENLGNIKDRVEVIIGALPEDTAKAADLLILSPGVPTDIPLVKDFRERGIPVWGEIELAGRFAKGSLCAITGTNGKTTTTALTGEIMKKFYDSVFVVGNIGIPYTEYAKQTTERSVIVAELSSFQLETVETVHPKVSAILNITPDHLNRHHTMDNYIAAKFNIARFQTPEDVCVLNYEDEELKKRSKDLRCRIVWFSSRQPLEEGLYVDGNEDIILAENGVKKKVVNVHEMNIIGRHNYENAMAAIAIAHAMKVPLELIREELREFKAVEHRIEYTATKKGVRYYNDSKGTNPDASIQAVRAMDAKTVLIGGGFDKKSEYDEWIEEFGDKIKLLVLIGQTAKDIAACCDRHGFKNYCFADSMEETVKICAENAKPGECVLLSPACASWGMFENYEQRGRIFKELVHKLPD